MTAGKEDWDKTLGDTCWPQTPLFVGLSEGEQAWLHGRLRFEFLSAGEELFGCDALRASVAVLLCGAAKVTLHRVEGGEVTFAILGAGEMLNDAANEPDASKGLRHLSGVTALEPSRVARLSREDFALCLDAMPIVSRNLRAMTSRRLARVSRHAECLATFDVPGRVACQLLQLADEWGEVTSEGARISLRLTQHDLAGLCGASRERVNGALAYFKGRGFLSCDAEHHMTLHDRHALEERCR
jgi:CRP/FNR family cyclic AMP-dependent transcriptional regulator